jgi:hypothetical protein
VVLNDTIAVTGWRAKMHGWLVLTLMPLMVALSAYLTHALVQTFEPQARQQSLVAAKCTEEQQR